MSNSGALDGAVDKYEKYHYPYGGDEEERKANCSDMVLDIGCGIGGPLREIARFKSKHKSLQALLRREANQSKLYWRKQQMHMLKVDASDVLPSVTGSIA